jgi:hypothetical protein
MSILARTYCLAAVLVLAPLTTWGGDTPEDLDLAFQECTDLTMGGIVPAPSEAEQSPALKVVTSDGAEGRSAAPADAGGSAAPKDGTDIVTPNAALAERLRRPEQ